MSEQKQNNPPDGERKGMVIIPADSNQRALAVVRRALPVLARNKRALGVLAGAVGSVALKKIVELAAEDLYERVRHFVGRRSRRPHAPRPRPTQEPLSPETPLIRARRSILFVGVAASGQVEERFASFEVREGLVALSDAAERSPESTPILVEKVE